MPLKKKDQPTRGNKKKGTRNPKKAIHPDKLLSDINQQNEALNNIIKKFGEPKPETGKPKSPKNRGKFNHK